MSRESVTVPAPAGIDWKGIGYLFSIAGTLLLGAKAWPKPTDPWWHAPALIVGILLSIAGFGARYFAHLKQRQEIRQAKREAEAS